MIRRSLVLDVALVGVLAACVAVVGAGERDGGAAEPRQVLTPSEEQALRRLQTVYVWRMTEAVGMSDVQAAHLYPEIHDAFRTRWPLVAQRRQLLVLLRQAVDAAARPDNLGQLLAQWQQNEAKFQTSQRRLWETLTRVLALEQQARYVLFEEQFHGDLVRVLEKLPRTSPPAAPPRPGAR